MPDMHELKAAAEDYLNALGHICDGNRGHDAEECHKLSVTRRALAQWAVSLLSDAPVTAEWLINTWDGHQEDHPQKVTFYRDGALPVGLWSVDDGWKAMLKHSDVAATCMRRGITTQGACTMFFLGLGLKLKEVSE